MDWLGLAYCFVGLFFWGVAPVIYRFCGDAFGPSKMQALRSIGFTAAAAVMLWLAPGDKIWPGGVNLLALMAMTIAGITLGDTLYFRCIARIGAGKAAALTSTYPLWVVVLSWAALGEGLSPLGLLGVVVIVVGLMLLCLFKERAGTGYGEQPVHAGLVTGLSAGLFWGFGIVSIRWINLHSAISSSAITFWRSLAVLFSVWPIYLLERRRSGQKEKLLNLRDAKTLLLIAAGVFILALPGWFVSQAMSRMPASMVSPITGSSPVVAALLALALFKEKISAMQWLGIVLIIGGGVLVNLP